MKTEKLRTITLNAGSLKKFQTVATQILLWLLKWADQNKSLINKISLKKVVLQILNEMNTEILKIAVEII